jgi:hypothetical protein
MINLSMTLKDKKTHQNQPKTKNHTKFKSVFFLEFKVKKTPNMNSSHQIKLFNTNIDCSDRLNWYQILFFLSIARI